ncbi:MAG: hypothetical protein ACJ8DZ_13830 [Allosphingosinicella sp.]
MSVDRPGETAAEMVDRRGREADARFREFWAGVEARRAAGIPDVPSLLPPAFSGPSFNAADQVQGREKRGGGGYA